MSTSFGFDAEVESEVNPEGSYIGPGIQKNIKVTEIKYLTGEEAGGTDAIELHLEDNNGKTLNHRYYNPSEGPYGGDKAIAKFNKVMKNLATKYMGSDYVFPPTDSFKSFAEQYIATLTPKLGDVLLRVKVVLNTNNYSKLPGYAPLFESMSVAEDQSVLKINEFDKIERTEDEPDGVTADAGASADGPF